MLKAKDQGHRRKCSPPKKTALQKIFSSNLKKNKIKGPSKNFQAISKEENKKVLRKFSPRFQAFSNKILTVQKLELSLSRGRGNF